jgi:hypothetical protein
MEAKDPHYIRSTLLLSLSLSPVSLPLVPLNHYPPMIEHSSLLALLACSISTLGRGAPHIFFKKKPDHYALLNIYTPHFLLPPSYFPFPKRKLFLHRMMWVVKPQPTQRTFTTNNVDYPYPNPNPIPPPPLSRAYN